MSNAPDPIPFPAPAQSPPPQPEQELSPVPKRHESYEVVGGGAAHNFQPSKEALKRYLATRKHPTQMADITFPGFFAQPSDSDVRWFSVAVVIEVITALVLSAIIVIVFNLPPIAGVLPFIAFVGFDVAFAIGHHWPLVPKRLLRENQALLVVPTLRAGTRQHEKYSDYLSALKLLTPAWHKWLSVLCAVLIVAMAIGKTLFLAANIQELGSVFTSSDGQNVFNQSSLDDLLNHDEFRYAIFMIFGLLYGVIAYIHLFHTGYAVAAIRLYRGLKKDRAARDRDPRDRKFLQTEQSERVDLLELANQLKDSDDPDLTQRAPSEKELNETLAQGLKVNMNKRELDAIKPHRITKLPDGTYEMTRVGVLTDDQLEAWTDMQSKPFARLAVALYGHMMQIHMIGGKDVDEKSH